MRIEFQYNFDEWLEWKRANLNSKSFICLSVAETLLKPLFFLCALSLIIALFQHFNRASSFTSFIPRSAPIVFLVLLAISNIYLSTMPHLRKKNLKEDWEVWITQPNYRLDITENGIGYISTGSTSITAWEEYTSVFQTKRLLMFCEGEGPDVLVIPKRAFGSKERLEEFIKLAYRKTVLERKDAESPKSD